MDRTISLLSGAEKWLSLSAPSKWTVQVPGERGCGVSLQNPATHNVTLCFTSNTRDAEINKSVFALNIFLIEINWVWCTSLQQRVQEVLQAVGEVAHHITGVAVLWEEEGQLKVRILLQLHFSAITPRQLICCVFCYCHHMVYEILTQRKHSMEMLTGWRSCSHFVLHDSGAQGAFVLQAGCTAHPGHSGSWS